MSKEPCTARLYWFFEEAKDFNGLEEARIKIVRELLIRALQVLDEGILKHRPEGYRVIGFRKRTIATRLGDITYVRRLYVK